MTQTTEISSREPVSDILSQASRLGLKLQYEKLPSGALFPYGAISESLTHPHPIRKPRRRPCG